MATKRFCDICDQLLKPEDDKPFIRTLFIQDSVQAAGQEPTGRKILGFVMITNENNHPLTDVCNGCKLRIVNDGKDEQPNPATVATLQPIVAADMRPKVELYQAPVVLPKTPPMPTPNPPSPPAPVFVPSSETPST